MKRSWLGGFCPEKRSFEGRWARQFGVAQVSIREALNILITDGFVTKGHGRSARVLKLGDPEIIQIYQLRGALEGLAARLAVEQKLPLDDLEAALAEMQHAVQQNDLRKVVDRVQQFHLCLLEKAGNPFLSDSGRRVIIPLYAFTRIRALAKNLDASPWEPQLHNHRRIVDAMRMGHPRLAEQVVVHVINLFLESALQVWAH